MLQNKLYKTSVDIVQSKHKPRSGSNK